MTKREKIIRYLADRGIDVTTPPVRSDRWDKPGTIVINNHFLTHDEWCKLDNIRRDWGSPVKVHTIRVRFEWMHGYNRLSWEEGRESA